jgi:hypothetical protein
MAIVNADHGKLLLTADLLQLTARSGQTLRKLDDSSHRRLALRFPPVDDLVNALDHIASREGAA